MGLTPGGYSGNTALYQVDLEEELNSKDRQRIIRVCMHPENALTPQIGKTYSLWAKRI